jgi:hypothetical protein
MKIIKNVYNKLKTIKKEKFKMKNIKLAIKGIKQASKILRITPPQVHFTYAVDFPNPEITSVYSHAKNYIIFNEDWVEKSSDHEILITAFHETRHAYQYYCIQRSVIEDIEIVKVWEKEFFNYTTPSEQNTPLSDLDYLKQSIEIDAIAFAYDQMKKLYNVKVMIPNEIKDLVLKRVEAIQ